MPRSFYMNTVESFLEQSDNEILGTLARNNSFDLNDLQKNTWEAEIQILKRELNGLDGTLAFEYTIPRIGNRIDNVLICRGFVFLLEFKVGDRQYQKDARNQVIDYALDLKNFHRESQSRTLVPILIATEAPKVVFSTGKMKEGIRNVISCNASNLRTAIEGVFRSEILPDFNAQDWFESIYMPTPTIIEAAQALYHGHNVSEISRNDAGAINLGRTTENICQIIERSKANHRKSICFVTGVPGAGKTLAGLNIANERHNFVEEEHAVFLSGNGPLVDVLQEALARDEQNRDRIPKREALKKAKAFIQLIHHFRDDALNLKETPPIEKVVIFDEAQRAWDQKTLKKFMKKRKGVPDFEMSEPEFLISVMNRHTDWAVIICLVGGGQEINTGEAGILEWFEALRRSFPFWDVYYSDQIQDLEYSHNHPISELLNGLSSTQSPDLHLGVSLRSFRSENVSSFVKFLLEGDLENARNFYRQMRNNYPIYLTRNLDEAKSWLHSHAHGSERYGIIASSGARRLKPEGIWVDEEINAPNWFLNSADDVRSSDALECTATEFVIQGLELDWTLLAWDANMRFEDGSWRYYEFRGTNWNRKRINSDYVKNAYRVLLTRARQGMVLYVPYGSPDDETRKPEWYDGIYDVLKSVLEEPDTNS